MAPLWVSVERTVPVPTHIRFVVRGIFGGTPEEWSTSCHFKRDNEGSGDASVHGDVNEGNVTSAVDAYFGSSLFASSVIVTDWRMYDIGTNGKMQGNGPLLHTYADFSVHGSGSPHRFPPQVALCATLVADDRGPAKFGRMYLPTPACNLDASGRVDDATIVIQAEGLTQFLKSVSDAIDLVGLNSSTALNVSTGPAGSPTGTKQEVDHIEMGHVLDTIRNRRKSLLEERHIHGQIDW